MLKGRNIRGMENEGVGSSKGTYPHTSVGSLSIRVSHAEHTIRFLVEEDNICDLAELSTLFTTVLFNFEDGGWIFL